MTKKLLPIFVLFFFVSGPLGASSKAPNFTEDGSETGAGKSTIKSSAKIQENDADEPSLGYFVDWEQEGKMLSRTLGTFFSSGLTLIDILNGNYVEGVLEGIVAYQLYSKLDYNNREADKGLWVALLGVQVNRFIWF